MIRHAPDPQGGPSGDPSDERERRLNDLLGQAFERPNRERHKFLAEACGNDGALLEEALAFLEHEDELGDFLESPAIAAKSPASGSSGISTSVRDFLGGSPGRTSASRPESIQSSEALEIGSTLGAYTVVGRLGAGGVGEVYRAHDSELQRDVALKILQQGLTRNAEAMSRFRREARLLASVNHPNIATIHGLEAAGGTRFLVMELVEGQNLAQLLGHGPLSVAAALRIHRQIARALEAAHKRGVIHRDLKPANVMVSPDGWVKVLDFGLAKALGAGAADGNLESSLTVAGSDLVTTDVTITFGLMGTVPYMSPEQLREKKVDRRSDVWAFGCVLFEALTGQRPFRGDNKIEVFNAILEREPPWEELPSDLPHPIWQLLVRCLHKEPDQRLQSMSEARNEVEEALQAYSATAVPPVPPADASRPQSHGDTSLTTPVPGSRLSEPTGEQVGPAFGWQRLAAVAGISTVVLAAILSAWFWRDDGPDPEVERLLQEGRYYSNLYRNRGRVGDKERALAAFQGAFEIDPGAGDPAGEIAMVHTASLDFGAPVVELLPEIKTWANRALEIDSRSSNAWAALGYIEGGRQPESYRRRLEYLLKAATYGPLNANAHNRLGSPLSDNSFTLAAEATRVGFEVDSRILISPLFEALCLAPLGRHEEALARADVALGIEETFPFAWWTKSALLSIAGRDEEARRLVTERLEPLAAEEKLHPSWVAVARDFAILGTASRQGDATAADEAAARLLALARGESPFPRWQIVTTEVAAQLSRWGRTEEAVELFRFRSRQGIFLPYDYLLFSPNLEAIRDDPRFQEVLEPSRERFDAMVRILDEARAQGEMPAYLERPLADLLSRIRRARQGVL